MSAPSRHQIEQAWCLVDGHRWQLDRYQDVLTPSGQLVMAGWAHMRCPCGATERITNPAADWMSADTATATDTRPTEGNA